MFLEARIFLRAIEARRRRHTSKRKEEMATSAKVTKREIRPWFINTRQPLSHLSGGKKEELPEKRLRCANHTGESDRPPKQEKRYRLLKFVNLILSSAK